MLFRSQDYHDLGERYPQAPVPKLSNDTIIHRASLEDITGIEKLINLKTLRFISKSISSKQYNSLSKLVNLENLDLSGNTNFKNTKSLINLTLIKDLNLAECQFIKHVNGLKNMLNLKKLNLDGCGRLENVDGLYNLTQLEEIDLNYCIEIGRASCRERV